MKLSIQLRLETFLTEREAMVAANQQRLSQEEAVAYDFSHFNALASQISELEDEIRENNKTETLEAECKNYRDLIEECKKSLADSCKEVEDYRELSDKLRELNDSLRSDRDTYRNFALASDQIIKSLGKAVRRLEDENEELAAEINRTLTPC